MTKKYVPYGQYLLSPHFTRQKRFAFFLSFRSCSICFQRYHLEAHHLSYKVLNRWFEFLFLRYVCRTHHDRVQTFFGKPLKGTLALHLNYYRFKLLYLSTVGVYRLIKWIVISYWVPVKFRGKRKLL
jgi:hypothetical protein